MANDKRNAPPPPADAEQANEVNSFVGQFEVLGFSLPASKQQAYAQKDGSTSIKLANVRMRLLPSGMPILGAAIKRRDWIEETPDGKREAVSETLLAMPSRSMGPAAPAAPIFVTEDADLLAAWHAYTETVVEAYIAWTTRQTAGKSVAYHETRGRVVTRRAL